MSDHAGELAAEGYQRTTLVPAALPHWIWSTELVFEQDRRLRLVDETVLQLVQVGVVDPDRIALLMGLDDSQIIPSSIANLMRLGALRHDQEIRLTDGGLAALATSSLREPAREGVQLHFDPYRQRVSFARQKREFLSNYEMRGRGLHQLPVVPEPRDRDLFKDHLEIQTALGARLRDRGGNSAVDLMRVVPVGSPQVVFEEIDIEVWHRASDNRWQWRLLAEGVEDAAAALILHQLEEEGADVLPLVPLTEPAEPSAGDRQLAELFEGGANVGIDVSFDAIANARELSLLIPAFPFGKAALALLLHLETRDEHSEDRVNVVFGSGERTLDSRMPDPLRDVSELLRKRGITVSNCTAPLRHGALTCRELAVVMRYGIDAVDARPGCGIAHVECRSLAPEQSATLRRIIAPLWSAERSKRG